jgi:hypothetical protein
MSGVSGSLDVLATDGLSMIGTVGFFVPAAVLVALVTGAVIRDRRLHAQEQPDDAGRRPTPPRAD